MCRPNDKRLRNGGHTTTADTDMVKDGVAYVHLTATADGSCGCGCGDPDCDCQDPDCDGGCCNQDCEHHFVCHDTVAPTCMALGYDRLMCTVKANYNPGPRLSERSGPGGHL